MGVPLLAAVASLATGCHDRACFRWSKSEGSCPSQAEALPFMTPTCDEVLVESVDSDGELEDDNLCCYDVTRSSDQAFACAANPSGGDEVSSGFSSGDGVSSPGCFTCSLAIQEVGIDPAVLCPFSAQLFDDLLGCVCGIACADVCADSVCAGTSASDACGQCAISQCVDQLNACVNDS